MATESGRAVLITRCLQLNVLALAFSLAHVVADWHIGLFGASSEAMSAPQAALLWLVSGLYEPISQPCHGPRRKLRQMSAQPRSRNA